MTAESLIVLAALVLAVLGAVVATWALDQLSTVTAVCRNCGDDPLGYVHVPVERGVCRLQLPARG